MEYGLLCEKALQRYADASRWSNRFWGMALGTSLVVLVSVFLTVVSLIANPSSAATIAGAVTSVLSIGGLSFIVNRHNHAREDLDKAFELLAEHCVNLDVEDLVGGGAVLTQRAVAVIALGEESTAVKEFTQDFETQLIERALEAEESIRSLREELREELSAPESEKRTESAIGVATPSEDEEKETRTLEL